MNCDQCRDMMLDLLYDEPAGESKAMVSEHLASCPVCARELAELKQTLSMVRESPEPELPPFLNTRVIAHVREAAGAMARPRSIWSWIFRPSTAAVAVIVITASVAIIFVESGYHKKPLLQGEMKLRSSHAGMSGETATGEEPAFKARAPEAPKALAVEDESDRALDYEHEGGTRARGGASEETPLAPSPAPVASEPPASAAGGRQGEALSQPVAAVETPGRAEEEEAERRASAPGGIAGLEVPGDEVLDKPAAAPPASALKSAAPPAPAEKSAKAPAEKKEITDADQGVLRSLGYVEGAPAKGAGPEKEAEGMSSLLGRAADLEAGRKYREALGLYEQALSRLGYEKGVSGKKKRETAPKAQTSSEAPASDAAAKDDQKAPGCDADVKKAADGAVRMYRKLLRSKDAKAVEAWYRERCPE